MKRSNSRLVPMLGWSLIVLVSTLVVLVIGEIVLRLIPPDPGVLLEIVTTTEDARGYRLQPNAQTRFRGMHDPLPKPISWQVNADGIRSDRPIAAKDGRMRMLTYGDSETFGWSVSLEDTWQRRMEARDGRIQVLNLGVPGYNAENVADHMELTAPRLAPDLIVYLFHKNDFYEPLGISPILSRSELYIHLRMGLYALGAKRRHAWRRTPEARRFVAAQMRRMLELSRRVDVPFVVAFRHWKYRGVLDADSWEDDTLERALTLPRSSGFSTATVNIEPVVKGFPRRDQHLIEPAQAALAEYLCDFLSKGEDPGCYWSGWPSG